MELAQGRFPITTWKSKSQKNSEKLSIFTASLFIFNFQNPNISSIFGNRIIQTNK